MANLCSLAAEVTGFAAPQAATRSPPRARAAGATTRTILPMGRGSEPLAVKEVR